MKLILVPVADRPECARALGTAFDLGKRLGASVSGCHMRPHRYSDVSLSSAFADAEWRKKSTKTAPASAKALYERAAEQSGYEVIRRPRREPGALWSEKVGAPGVLMGISGPASDLVVVSRPAREGGVAEMFLKAALLDSTAPTLILPQRGRKLVGRRILIGWNQSPEAARAVRAAVPLLAVADEVTLVTCGAEDRPGPKAQDMARYLAFHGIQTERVTTRGRDIDGELVAAFRDVNADLLLTGAYSRSRWREKIFGGTTEHLLTNANIPLLTLHS
jgi:nucleotide-binding universal stress UspA family protein